MAKEKLKDYIGLFEESTEGREECTVTIHPLVDVAFTMVTDLEGTKKSDVIHMLLRDYINTCILDLDVKTLAEYSQRGKKTDTMAKKEARYIMAEKIMESINIKLPDTKEDDEQEQKSA